MERNLTLLSILQKGFLAVSKLHSEYRSMLKRVKNELENVGSKFFVSYFNHLIPSIKH